MPYKDLKKRREYQREYQRKWREKNIDRVRKNLRVARNEPALQDKECAICDQEETVKRNGRRRRLSWDHDHETGEIRGVLCSRCNTALGLLRDSESLCRSAADYLERWRQRLWAREKRAKEREKKFGTKKKIDRRKLAKDYWKTQTPGARRARVAPAIAARKRK